ncbi:hypothetical protein [Agromyces sp. NPDC058126]|uniref:hypothetical protein n=1 Tax=Agromyces sp. NPDC058126 TaxID=3346350 RepID=UPI0036DD6E6D
MTDRNSNAGCFSGGGAIYGLGVIGAWVFNFQQADQFWLFIWAFFQGIFWTDFMVYELFTQLVSSARSSARRVTPGRAPRSGTARRRRAT